MNLPLANVQGAVPIAPVVQVHNLSEHSIEEVIDDCTTHVYTGASSLIIHHKTSIDTDCLEGMSIVGGEMHAWRTTPVPVADTLISRIDLQISDVLTANITAALPQTYIDALTEWLAQELAVIARDSAIAGAIAAAEDC